MSPLLTAVGLSIWITYATVRVFDAEVVLRRGLPLPHAVLLAVRLRGLRARVGRVRPVPAGRQWFIPFAAVTLPFLRLFRVTCYYYRKAYYRSFWFSPPACAVAEPHKAYSGETRFPLIFQNVAPLLLLRGGA